MALGDVGFMALGGLARRYGGALASDRQSATLSAEQRDDHQCHQQDDAEHDREDPPQPQCALDDRRCDDGDVEGVERIAGTPGRVDCSRREHVIAGGKALLKRRVGGIEDQGEICISAYRRVRQQPVVEQEVDFGEGCGAVDQLDAQAYLTTQHWCITGHAEAWRDGAKLDLDRIAGSAGEDGELTAADGPFAEVDGDLIDAAAAEQCGKPVADGTALRLVGWLVADADHAGIERFGQAGECCRRSRHALKTAGIIAAEADDDELHGMLACVGLGQPRLDRGDIDRRAGIARGEYHQRTLCVVGRLLKLVEASQHGITERIGRTTGGIEWFGSKWHRRIGLVDHIADQPQIMAQRDGARMLDLVGERHQPRQLIGLTLQCVGELARQRAGVFEAADERCGAGIAHARAAIEDQRYRDGDA